MDTIRANFFWQGATDNFKYHMVKWPNMCIPKEWGGLGIIDTRTMNEALVAKWGWRVLKANPEDQVYLFFRNKYLKRASFFQCSQLGGSQFWKGVLKTRRILRWGTKVAVNYGECTSFWDDVWTGDVPFRLVYPSLYDLSSNQNCLMNELLGWGWLEIEIQKTLGGI